jgi:hypothetical protein
MLTQRQSKRRQTPTQGLSFMVEPSRATIGSVTKDRPMRGCMSGFTPNSTVTISILLPDGAEGNRVGGSYQYGTTANTDALGRFPWTWWASPTDMTGTYAAMVVDDRSGQSVTTTFTLTAE